MSDKIRRDHLQRTAYVYVRQSTPHQVRNHLESKERQYGLAERAQQLGFSNVIVIDEDLGRSGGGTQERPGFGRLLASVRSGLGRSRFRSGGISIGTQQSGLASPGGSLCVDRNPADRQRWHLRSTTAQRSFGAWVEGHHERVRTNLTAAACSRGFRTEGQARVGVVGVAVGFVRTAEDRIEKTPDRQVQQGVTLVFQKFRQLGSARQAMIWFREEQIPVPQVQPGTGGHEIVWALPSSGRLLQMLRNPCYAGVFAYGKTAGRIVMEQDRARQGSRYRKPQSEWKVLIADHHSGYISGEEFVQNQQQLDANTMCDGEGSGAAKTGAALLSGLLRCGRCGRKLQTVYSGSGGRVPRYTCRGDRGDRGSAHCQTVGSLRLDRAVVSSVLEAIQPVGIEAAWSMAESNRTEDEEKKAALDLALERARYEANRARRQFDAVDPENRLVAGELEARWNRALAQVAELERRVSEMENAPIIVTNESRAELMMLCEQLPAVWEHPDAPVQLKKRILRTVLNEIIINPEQDPSMYRIRLHWAGGVHTELTIARNKTGQHGRSVDGWRS